jgi:hypothetical protein
MTGRQHFALPLDFFTNNNFNLSLKIAIDLGSDQICSSPFDHKSTGSLLQSTTITYFGLLSQVALLPLHATSPCCKQTNIQIRDPSVSMVSAKNFLIWQRSSVKLS